MHNPGRRGKPGKGNPYETDPDQQPGKRRKKSGRQQHAANDQNRAQYPFFRRGTGRP